MCWLYGFFDFCAVIPVCAQPTYTHFTGCCPHCQERGHLWHPWAAFCIASLLFQHKWFPTRDVQIPNETLWGFVMAHGHAGGAHAVHQLNEGDGRGQRLFILLTWLEDVFQKMCYRDGKLFILACKLQKIESLKAGGNKPTLCWAGGANLTALWSPPSSLDQC